MSRVTELKQQIVDLEKELEEARGELKIALKEAADITNEVVPVLLQEEGFIRLALKHDGEVIVRSGAGEPLSLTAYAQANGYALELGRKAVRGSYFKVTKRES